MKLLLKRITFPILTVALLSACFSARESGKQPGTSQHMALHKHGITIDARYNPQLDNLIPGYKIMTVALTNNSIDVLRLNPLKDRWEIVDAMGRKHRAINSLRIKSPSVFSRLPPRVQQLIDYPVGISVGYSETIDLFFPQRQDLNAFRSISFYSADRKQTYDMLSNLDSPTHVPANDGKEPPMDPRFKK